VNHPGLLAPGREARNLTPFPDGDGEVLVPGHLPVGVGGLVEEGTADGEGVGAEDRGNHVSEDGAAGQGGDFGEIEEVTVTGGGVDDKHSQVF